MAGLSGQKYFIHHVLDKVDVDNMCPNTINNENQDLLKIVMEAVEELPPMVRILDKQTLTPVYQNKQARLHEMDAATQKSIQALIAKLKDSGESLEKREEGIVWDTVKDTMRRRRLYDLDTCYWFTETQLANKPEPDPDLIHFFRAGETDHKLKHLAEKLHQSWGVTRLRFYRVAKLYRDNDEANQIDHLVLQPIWHHDVIKGFKQSEAWKNTEFPLKGNEQFHFTEGKAITLINVPTDMSRMEAEQEAIEWGNAENFARFTLTEVNSVTNQPEQVGSIVIDRRTDHFEGDQKKYLENTPIEPRILEKELDSMEKFFKKFSALLLSIIHEIRSDRQHLWDEILRKITKRTTETSDTNKILTFAFERILEEWNTQSGKLRDAYLLRIHPQGDFEPWVGVGPLFTAHGKELFAPKDLPSLSQTQVNVTQVYQQEQDRYFAKLFSKEQQNKAQLDDLGSWVSIPLSHEQRYFAILVFAATKRNYFTTHRIKRLQDGATALMPLLLWADTQSQRDWFRRALAHEFQEPVNYLNRLAKKLPDEEDQKWMKALLKYQTILINNLRYLGEGKMEGDVLKVSVKKVLNDVLDTVRGYYRQRLIAVSDGSGLDREVLIKEQALYQILFNLIENACKYTTNEAKPVRISIESISDDSLCLLIKNSVSKPIPSNEKEHIFLPYRRASNVGSANGSGIGLAVVKQLATAFYCQCDLINPGSKPEMEVCFKLTLPLVK